MSKKLNWWDYRVNIWKVICSYFSKTPPVENIPEGMYCYKPKEFPSEENGWRYKIEPCPYYVTLPKGYNHCKFCKTTTDDMCFDDQVKICGENYGFEEE